MDRDFDDLFDNKENLYKDDEDIKVGFEFTNILDVMANENDKKKVNIPKAEKNNLLKIVAYPTAKNKIKQRPLMKNDIIPKHPARVIFNGKSGSGKSNLMIQLLTQPHFYGRTKSDDKKSQYFDLIFLFSPTADGQDDLVRFLKLPEKRIITDFNVSALDNIFDIQDNIIKSNGIEKSPKILIIFDDVQSDPKFMRTKSFKRAFIQGRHCNMSVFICCQSWTKLDRMCRLQASNIFFFPSSQSECSIVCEEYCPPNTTKKDFMGLLKHATSEPYSFLNIDVNQKDPKKKFRKNLDTYLTLNNETAKIK
jgi:hypothetical protein